MVRSGAEQNSAQGESIEEVNGVFAWQYTKWKNQFK